jgi:predicted nucleotidyltransferase
MVNVLERNLPDVIRLFKKHRVKRAYAFGSAVNGGFKPESDVDLLVAFEDGLDPLEYGQHYFALADELEHVLQRSVDLLTEKQLKNEFFISRLNESKALIYE